MTLRVSFITGLSSPWARWLLNVLLILLWAANGTGGAGTEASELSLEPAGFNGGVALRGGGVAPSDTKYSDASPFHESCGVVLSPEIGDEILCALLVGMIVWGRSCVSSCVSPLGLVGGFERDVGMIPLGAEVV